jgi:hypothetical protein
MAGETLWGDARYLPVGGSRFSRRAVADSPGLVFRTGGQASTESVEAPGLQGATSAAYPLRYASKEQRNETGCIAARMQHDLRYEN